MTPRLLTNHDFANLIHMTDYTVGFIGLGNMGGPMAANLAKAGTTLLVHDAAGTQARAPSGAGIAADNLVVARGAEVALLSLPDGEIVQTVVDEIAGVEKRRLHTVIDTSSVGIAAARKAHARLAEAGVEYIDSPVSGGVSGARNASIAVMFAGSDEAYERYAPLLQQTAAKVVQVGHEPGMGQAMKLLNNFLSGTALAAQPAKPSHSGKVRDWIWLPCSRFSMHPAGAIPPPLTSFLIEFSTDATTQGSPHV